MDDLMRHRPMLTASCLLHREHCWRKPPQPPTKPRYNPVVDHRAKLKLELAFLGIASCLVGSLAFLLSRFCCHHVCSIEASGNVAFSRHGSSAGGEGRLQRKALAKSISNVLTEHT